MPRGRALPDDASSADTLGWAYYHKGIYSSAINLFKEAVKKEPDNATYNYHLGLAYARNGQGAQARQQLDRVVKIKPDSSEVNDLRQALAQLKLLDGEVTQSNVDAKDVTDQFTDLKARLTAKRAEEARYLQMVPQAKTVDEMLKIEIAEGFQRALDNNFQRLRENARREWESRSAGNDPSNACVTVRISTADVTLHAVMAEQGAESGDG